MQAGIFVFDDQTAMLDRTTDGKQELAQFHRLQEKIQCAPLHEIDGEGSFILSGQEDYFDAGIVLLDDVEQFRAGPVRHLEV